VAGARARQQNRRRAPAARLFLCCLFALVSTAPLPASPGARLPGAEPLDAALAARLEAAWRTRPSGHRPRTRHLEADGAPKYTNRLLLETSPYLLQHAHNPVNWYPWGDEAFEAARRLGRPVLLSIGYSTCHWCHVMEEESFDDEEIARLLNEGYVAIKVDREERPDLDAVYMAAVQSFTGGAGGWPMTVWLTPAREPFFGGSYFPPRDGDRGVRVGFSSLLRRLQTAYSQEKERVALTASTLAAAIREALPARTAPSELPDAALLREAARFQRSRYDRDWGGVKGAPKFPASLPVRFLLRYHRRSGDAPALGMATVTLEKIARGGIRDHLAGGFHRYAVDARWQVPHFEKMLYDNALLALAYLEAHEATRRDDFARVVHETLRYVEREMTSPEGAFYSASDADSPAPSGKREEGRFFTWTSDEIRAALGPERAALVEAVYGVAPEGPVDGRSVLWLPRPLADVARERGLEPADAERELSQARAFLLKKRAGREPPQRDEKILAAWNGLMIGAFARAALSLDEPRYAARAARAAGFVLERMREGGRLLRSYSRGRARHTAYLEDYAFLIAGLLDLHEATSEPRWLEEAIALDRVLERRYEDAEGGGYFMTADDHERLLVRSKPIHDGAEPSGNAVQALNLLRLHELLSDDRYRRRAERTLAAARLAGASAASSEWLLAIDFHLDTPKQIVIVTPSGRADAAPLLAKLRSVFVPNRVLVVASAGADLAAQARLVPLLEGKTARSGRATAYVCERRVCELPTTDPEVFRRQIAKTAALPEPGTAAEAKALAYLREEVPGWRREHGCGSCHNNGDAARALFRARELGYRVDDRALLSTREWLTDPLQWERQAGEPGTSDPKLARLQFGASLLAAFEAGVIADSQLLDRVAAQLARDQDADGAWRIAGQASLGSPVAYGPFVATWLARRVLAHASGVDPAADQAGAEIAGPTDSAPGLAAGGQAAALAAALVRSEAWLIANPAKNVMDAAAAALALAGSEAQDARERRRDALALLRAAQNPDGGFGPYRGSASEPFDTALALLAMSGSDDRALAGAAPRAREWLARAQLETGGWRETTRPAGYQSYAQHISTSGWATLALLETVGR
jgi:uncharacterized protein YyaL (SSP411 family)